MSAADLAAYPTPPPTLPGLRLRHALSCHHRLRRPHASSGQLPSTPGDAAKTPARTDLGLRTRRRPALL